MFLLHFCIPHIASSYNIAYIVAYTRIRPAHSYKCYERFTIVRPKNKNGCLIRTILTYAYSDCISFGIHAQRCISVSYALYIFKRHKLLIHKYHGECYKHSPLFFPNCLSKEKMLSSLDSILLSYNIAVFCTPPRKIYAGVGEFCFFHSVHSFLKYFYSLGFPAFTHSVMSPNSTYSSVCEIGNTAHANTSLRATLEVPTVTCIMLAG